MCRSEPPRCQFSVRRVTARMNPLSLAIFLALLGSTTNASDRIEELKRLVESRELDSWKSVCPSLGAEGTGLCRRLPGLAKTIRTAANLAATHCQALFKYQRWNCTYNKNTFNRVTRESGLLGAVYTSAVAWAVGKACSSGELGGCSCGGPQPQPQPQAQSLWAASLCPHNIPRGRHIAKRILRLARTDGPDEDLQQAVTRHNSLLGLRVLNNHVKEVCKCHGVSGSCESKSCWKQLPPFRKIVRTLRSLYITAERFEPNNSIQKRGIVSGRQRKRLLYLDPSEDPCPGTRGRRCRDRANCSVLCCARGYIRRTVNRYIRCNCAFNAGYRLHCHRCLLHRRVRVCK